MNSWKLKRVSKRYSHAPIANSRLDERQLMVFDRMISKAWEMFCQLEIKPYFERENNETD